jgi:hypothetical protein
LQTGKDGVVKRNLLMGKYFVKAVLKEYSFEPDQQIVDLGEGQKLKINLKAKRIEYSVLGKVNFWVVGNGNYFRSKFLGARRLPTWTSRPPVKMWITTVISTLKVVSLEKRASF